jgi:hypothetical protein
MPPTGERGHERSLTLHIGRVWLHSMQPLRLSNEGGRIDHSFSFGRSASNCSGVR